jgi:hypothetical protein
MERFYFVNLENSTKLRNQSYWVWHEVCVELGIVQLLESRPSFQKTNSPDEMIVEGWQKKFSLPDRVVEPTASA